MPILPLWGDHVVQINLNGQIDQVIRPGAMMCGINCLHVPHATCKPKQVQNLVLLRSTKQVNETFGMSLY